jgi:hypothetical protein
LDVDFLFKITGGAGGIIGTLLGLINLWLVRRKETDAKLEEENNLSMLAAVMKAHMKHDELLLLPEIGSSEWKQAEKLVHRGILVRGPKGRGYCIPGTFDK